MITREDLLRRVGGIGAAELDRAESNPAIHKKLHCTLVQ